MKKSELIANNRKSIAETIVALERKVFENNGQTQYELFMHEDGSIEVIEQPFGGNSGTVEEPETFYITTVGLEKPATPWELTNTKIPEDEDERQERLEELLDYLKEMSEAAVGDEVALLIENAKAEEEEE